MGKLGGLEKGKEGVFFYHFSYLSRKKKKMDAGGGI